MNVELNELTQLARVESLCGHCQRPWFGVVAYCPYCGSPQGGEAVASRRGALGIAPMAVERDTPTPGLNKSASTLLVQAVIAGVTALLLVWMVVRLVSPPTDAGAPPRLPMAGSLTSATPMPVVPAIAERAAPPRSATSPCSAGHEAAGLCKSQE